MATNRYGRQRGQAQAEGGGPPPKKKGNEALVVGLIVGGLAAVVLLFFLASGGGMPESEVADAKTFLRKFFQACLENNQAVGVPMMEPKESLREENPNDIKQWRTLSAERVKELQEQAFSFLRVKVIGKPDLELTDMTQVDKILAACDIRANQVRKVVEFQWSWRGVTWTAIVSRDGEVWKVYRLDRR